jgi:hypothetical protein
MVTDRTELRRRDPYAAATKRFLGGMEKRSCAAGYDLDREE